MFVSPKQNPLISPRCLGMSSRNKGGSREEGSPQIKEVLSEGPPSDAERQKKDFHLSNE